MAFTGGQGCARLKIRMGCFLAAREVDKGTRSRQRMIFFFFWPHCGVWMFPGQGLNPYNSSDNTGSSTTRPPGKFDKGVIRNHLYLGQNLVREGFSFLCPSAFIRGGFYNEVMEVMSLPTVCKPV